MITLKYLPERTGKPRNKGLTMVMDKGLGMRQAEDLVETAASLIDFIKLGFGTSYVNRNVKDKIKLRAGDRSASYRTLIRRESYKLEALFLKNETYKPFVAKW